MFGLDLRTARVVWTAALVLGGLYCVYAIRTTLLVVLIAALFSYLVHPLFVQAQRLAGMRLPRLAVLLLVFVLVLCLIGLVVVLFGSRIAEEAALLAKEVPALMEPGTLEKRLPLPGPLEPFRERLAVMLQGLVEGGSAQALSVVRNVGAGLFHAAGNAVYVVAVPILSFLMIYELPAIELLMAALGSRPNGGFWRSVAFGINFLLSRYVRALGLLSLATMVVYSAVLGLLGVPFALLLAGVAATFEVIPVFGPLAAGLTIVGVAAFSGYDHVWWLVIFLVGYRMFQDYVLSPYVMSEGVDLPPILVVLGLLAGDELAGVVGIFLSVPFLAAVRIVAVQVRLQRTRSEAVAAPEAGAPPG
jgi:predicted PurR-regulated permease PerM